MKALALGLLVTTVSATSAVAHSGHAVEGSVLHATQHASGTWLIAAAVIMVAGISAAALTRALQRKR